VVAYQNEVSMAETLDGALAQLFGGSAAPRGEAVPTAAAGGGVAAPVDAQTRALLVEARQHYDNAMQAQRAGDWATYGTEIRQLGELLARIGAGRR
jgi:uncharacterized membrane protein (UPF0182 family)